MEAESQSPPAVHPEFLEELVAKLHELVETDLPRVKAEILRHLDGNLVLVPELAPPGACSGPS